ncbi:GntR family transcriptional regulator [Altericroceibacterium spongiae]|uniref:GntR family transcriptional regulator n=1 Tax=Altericroceibacterium spongiae TaxID=2320269 RepID=A0A420EQX3_9SPHN|nr:GntR family transcriptional regulator [Altericroceibacterium spongiae]RKF23075.1 GntR family transcriptional regulator [Altericroceibacterium spongiae]
MVARFFRLCGRCLGCQAYQPPRERVIRDVLRVSYEGSFVSGERLTEAKLTVEKDVNGGPVREALNRLAASHLEL